MRIELLQRQKHAAIRENNERLMFVGKLPIAVVLSDFSTK